MALTGLRDVQQLAFAAAFVVAAFAGQAVAPAPANAALSQILARLNSNQPKARASAFDALLRFKATEGVKHPEYTDTINASLIQALHRENQRWTNARLAYLAHRSAPQAKPKVGEQGEDEGESDFLGGAIQAVAALKDPRAIPVLLEDIETGNMALEALAAEGGPIIGPLIKLLSAKAPGDTVCEPAPTDLCVQELHESAMAALAKVAQPKIFAGLRPAQQAKLADTLLEGLQSDDGQTRFYAVRGLGLIRGSVAETAIEHTALHDPDGRVRFGAVQVLGTMKDPALRPLLYQIAAHDPKPVVRQAAQEALRHLGSH